ncbi:hypothetical protein, unlikely [Trypanosoma brucei brucei TREU927]|uniref:Uncharacterized protein n=1 Tax=Trypanosoma brucei brucei (strain 927/4 GUTat10.1) TaxID=185431 RepID=Q4GYG3_TRYB2|nr:hypothetical protein, unlikely [Trypanosoma brucei brucei TREU927]CAJ16621.1 hypothetical protein, unlikely [Trypanosoma brucei brucei TREU927]
METPFGEVIDKPYTVFIFLLHFIFCCIFAFVLVDGSLGRLVIVRCRAFIYITPVNKYMRIFTVSVVALLSSFSCPKNPVANIGEDKILFCFLRFFFYFTALLIVFSSF